MMYDKSYKFSLITLTGVSFTWDAFFGSSFSSSFSVWSEDVYSKKKFGLSSFEILPVMAFKLGRSLYVKIAASTRSKRFKLNPFILSLGKFLLVTVNF